MAAAPPNRTLVAVEGETVLGTAKMGPNHRGPAAHIGNASFMVAPEHGGKGVGRALGSTSSTRPRGRLPRHAVQRGRRNQHSAVRLWQSLGFEIIGTLPEAFHHPTKGYVGLHIMFRRL